MKTACSAELIKEISDGDILLFRGTSCISKMFQASTGSYYSHSAMAVWWGDRLMVLQAAAVGVQAVPFFKAVCRYKGSVDWYSLQRDSFIADSAFEERLRSVLAEAKTNIGTPFGLVEVIHAIWLHLTRRRHKTRLRQLARPKAMFCSMFVAWCFYKGGLPLVEDEPEKTFPQDFEDSARLTPRGSLCRDAYCTGMGDDPDKPPPCGKPVQKMRTWRHRREEARRRQRPTS